MSQFWVAGPAYIFTGTGSNSALEFLGFTEEGLRVVVNGLFEDVRADYAGNMPADVSMLGQEARISGVLVRYNEDILDKIISFISGATPGEGATNSVGTLLMTEGGAYPLAINSPYQSKTVYAALPAWYVFPFSYLVDNVEFNLSTRRKALNVTWRAIPDFANTAPYPYGQYALYNNTTPSPVPAAN